MSLLQLKIPALGESIAEATIGRWKRAEGEAVKVDEPLVEVESDKATVDVPSPATGVLRRILRKPGETVPVGEIIAEIEAGAQVAAAPAAVSAVPPADGKPIAVAAVPSDVKPLAVAAAPAEAKPIAGAAVSAAPLANGTAHTNGDVKASPALRRLMAEHDLGAADVKGSGPAGRIERNDVDRALVAKETAGRPAPVSVAAAPVAPLPAPARRADPRERVVAMTPLRRTVARRLLEAQNTAAILTTFNEVNMAEVMAIRERHQDAFVKKHGIKLGFMSFFVKAAVDALKAFPLVNAEVRGQDIIYKDYYDIGVAVGGGKGLVVPVVRNADKLSLAGIERGIAELAGKAKENKLTLQDLDGGTFTISNGGIYGSMMSTPILNPPQSGILGLHNITKRPIAIGDNVVVRPMMYIALSYDHRIIDGREAVQFLVRIKDCIESPERMLIEV